MKIIFNISNLNGAGVVQIAQSFLEECRNTETREFHVFLSKQILGKFHINTFPDNFKFYEIKKTPARSISSLLHLRCLEKSIKPDCVFSLFGPSYWTPKSPHLMGFALPFLIYQESPYFLKNPSTFFHKLEKKIKMRMVLLNTKHYHVETLDIKNRLVSDYKIKSDSIFIINGTYNQIYDKGILSGRSLLPKHSEGEFRFVTIAALYKYKNIEIINDIIQLFKAEKMQNIKFVLTIDSILFKKHFGKNAEYIYNLGPVKIEDCPLIYSECDATFMPSLMESFTSTYPDSMKMKKPIITTDLPFARTVCGNAALYYDPLSANSAFQVIKRLVKDNKLQNDLITYGQHRIENFGTASDRAKKYLDALDIISNRINA
jgi:hypothetical protein